MSDEPAGTEPPDEAVKDGPPGDLAQFADSARRSIVFAIVRANVVGAVVVFVLLGFVLPVPTEAKRGRHLGGLTVTTAVPAAVYVVAAVLVGRWIGIRLARPVVEFYRSGRRPGAQDRRAVLRLPLVLLGLQSALWGLAVIVFGALSLRTSLLFAFEVAVTAALGGIPSACIAYLDTQRLLRPATSVVLNDVAPKTREVPGVGPRSLLAWALGIVPLGGIVALAGFAPANHVSLGSFALAAGVLSGVSLVVGFIAVVASARAVVEPLQLLRNAFAQIEEGDLDVDVPIFDATEIGYATAGFNRMVGGLRERERLQDLFGRQVGTDVAQRALEQGVSFTGEERDAAVLFVDIIGSTAFAADRPPAEVVTALNDFFEIVIDVTQEHDGLVNKFIGDAALCVFGAPLDAEDAAGRALAAARVLAQRLRDGPLDAGIGVAAGTVVAGNIGSAQRYEYTVIGDPVNEAARLTELAKERDGRVVASADAVQAAGEAERGHWQVGNEKVDLRGRQRPTTVATPRK